MDALQVGIRRPTQADADAWLAAVERSADLHHPWVTPPADREAFTTYLDGIGQRRLGFLIEHEDGLVGAVNASEIVHGAFRSCYLGYYAFAPLGGRGLMRAGLARVLDRLFTTHELHRAEANIQPHNTRSIELVRSLGFRKEGYSPDYLFIDGAWRDHERWAIVAGTSPTPRRGA